MAKVRLSPAFQGAVGQFNGYVVVNGRSGLVLKRKPTYRRPTSPAQQEAAKRLAMASKAWAGLDALHAAAWHAYAETQIRHDPFDGTPYAMTGNTAFIALATKYLQVSPDGEIPLLPPDGGFVGDDVQVTVGADGQSGTRVDSVPDGRDEELSRPNSLEGGHQPRQSGHFNEPCTSKVRTVRNDQSASASGNLDSEHHRGSHTTSDPGRQDVGGHAGTDGLVPQGSEIDQQNASSTRGPVFTYPRPLAPSLQSQALVFMADRANHAGVTTELMVQKLESVRSKPRAKYTTAQFVEFAVDHLEAFVPVEPGTWACATRFVEIASGKATLPVPIGVVVVE